MDEKTLQLLEDLNRAVIQFRGLYSAWSARHGISYHEMLVLYTLRNQGYCTQKQICDSYLLPRQTINNVIAKLHMGGLLRVSREHSSGREKAFVLTQQGEEYARPLIESLSAVEQRSVDLMGEEKVRTATEHLMDYVGALHTALEEEG